MRTLCLLRHAKSSWADPSLEDHDRPLARRGQEAAPAIGAWIKAQGLQPDLVLCSSAVRARETWSLVEQSLGSGLRVETGRELYLAGPRDLLRVVQVTPPAITTLLIIGHNPALATFANDLTGDGAGGSHKRMRRKFPTAALAVIAFDVERWDDVACGTGNLTAFVRPKDLT